MPNLPLNKESIATLVHTFYDDVRADPLLAPVFNAAIGAHWETHLGRMVDFWCTTMLKTQQFQGNVFGKHMALSGIEPDAFPRWLALFEATAARLFDAPWPTNSRWWRGASPPACSSAFSAKSR